MLRYLKPLKVLGRVNIIKLSYLNVLSFSITVEYLKYFFAFPRRKAEKKLVLKTGNEFIDLRI
jgi:hypothetical protein